MSAVAETRPVARPRSEARSGWLVDVLLFATVFTITFAKVRWAAGGADVANDTATAAGSPDRKAPGAPLPNANAGALIGRVGTNGPVFAIGDQNSLTVQESGQLYLGINDDQTSDNRGEFRVKIQRAGRAR